MNTIEVNDYEVVLSEQMALITYSLIDCEALIGLGVVNMDIKENNHKYYDIDVSTINGDSLARFTSLDERTVADLKGKTILLGGISEATNDVEEICKVKNLTLQDKKSPKIGI